MLRIGSLCRHCGHDRFLEILVTAVDGNCQGFQTRRQQIEHLVGKSYAGALVPAVPDPHIERWYLADPSVVGRILGNSSSVAMPVYKGDRKRYKHLPREAFVLAGLDDPPAGGIVFGDDIAALMDLRVACRLQDLDQFVSDFRAAIRRAAAGRLHSQA